MHNPDYLLHVSEGAEEISEMLHNDIIKRIIGRIMLRIGRGDDYILTAQDKWQLETLQQAGYLLEDIQKEIAKVTKLQQKEIAEAMEEAGVKTLEYDDEVYRSVGLDPKPFTQSPELIRIAQRNYEATMGEFKNFTRTMALQSQQLFIKECDRAYTLVSTGAMSYTEAVKEVINNIVSDGVKVKYSSGREDTIETATLRAVRTGISQMSAQITDARMEEMDWDIILVSSHLGARVTDREDYTNHYWWQGKFYSKSGKDKRFPPFSLCGFGKVQGIHGTNCRHSHGPGDGVHNPFKDYDSEENQKMYEKQQRQRTLERKIRDTKREVLGLKESVDSCGDTKAKFELDLQYQKKSALLAKQNKAYKEYCENNNLRPLADRIQIAKWDRQQAAAARGASKRYENAHGGSVAKPKIIVPKNKYGEEIQFDWKGKDEKHVKQQEVLTKLSNQYETRLKKVTIGAHQAAGDVDITGSTMRLSTVYPPDAVHEFAHTMANSKADKYGLTNDAEFWKEIKKIKREYKKYVGDDRKKWISLYGSPNAEVDEFFAEAFTQAKMSEYGLELPEKYSADLTYSKKVLEIIDKYFKKKKK